MKVLVIVADINKDNLGGAEWHFVEVFKRLSPRLEKSTLVVGSTDEIKSLFSKDNVEIVKVKYPHITNFYGLVFILYALPVSWRLASNNKFDLIWAKQEFPQGVVAVIIHLFFKIPLYVTSQSARLNKDELVIKGHLPNYFKEFLSDVLTPVISFVFKHSNMVGAVSHFSKNQAKRMGAVNIEVVPNGVDLDLYKIDKEKTSAIFQIVTTSSLINRNAVDVLIRACALLPTEINWKLVIAGDGILRKELEDLVSKLNVSNKVDFLGRIANTRIPKLLKQSNVFVRVSRAEGFGSSFIEAMAAKIPVIATPVGGITDFLTNNVTGLIVPVDDEVELSNNIIRLYNQPVLEQKLVAKAYKLVSVKYNWDNIAEKVWSLWLSIINK